MPYRCLCPDGFTSETYSQVQETQVADVWYHRLSLTLALPQLGCCESVWLEKWVYHSGAGMGGDRIWCISKIENRGPSGSCNGDAANASLYYCRCQWEHPFCSSDQKGDQCMISTHPCCTVLPHSEQAWICNWRLYKISEFSCNLGTKLLLATLQSGCRN